MKTTKFTCLSLLILTGTVLVSRAEPYRTDINPALLYYRAFLLAPEPMSEADRDYLSSKQGKEQKLPERFGQIVANHDNQFLLVRQATHATVPCDWGIDLSPGPGTPLPHLAPARRAAQAAQLRAVWDLQNGNEAAARDDLLAAMALGRNLPTATNGTLIQVLVKFAIANIVDATVAENFGRFSPETLKQLADGFDAVPAGATVADAAPTEGDMHLKWLSYKVQELRDKYPGDDAAVMEGLNTLFRGFSSTNWTAEWKALTNAAGGSSEGIIQMVRDDVPLHAQLAALMALPHGEYEKQLEQFDAEVQKSGNFFFPKEFPSWQKSRVREFRIQAIQAMVRAAVEFKLHGEAGLKSVMDPFGNGPFGFQRFVFKGVDRGFELKSAYAGADAPFVMIFVEKQGPAFQITGPDAGKAIDK